MAQSIFRQIVGRLEKAIFGETVPTPARRGKAKSHAPKREKRSLRISSPDPIADTILARYPVFLAKGHRSTFAQLAAKEGRFSPYIRSEVEHATAFLFGVISDRMIKAEKAWEIPFEVSRRLKHLSVTKIATMDASELERVLREPKNLHRFNAATARGFIAASKHLVDAHGGSALNMFKDGTDASSLLAELESLPGVSHKLSAMTLQILVTQLGIDLHDLPSVNVAVDRHLARVFLRTGMVKGEPGKKVYRAAKLKPAILAAARQASPTFPAALDLGAFWIGKQWCNHTKPKCGECPLRDVCPQDRRTWVVGFVKKGKISAE